jgi:hypothetical protein
MFSNPGIIRIDHECKYFACLAGLEYKKDFFAEGNKFRVFANTPCVIHFQGFHKDTRVINDLFKDKELRALGKKLLRLPSPLGKFLGDSLVKLGSYMPVDKKYFVHSGVCLLLMILILAVKIAC